MVAPASHPPRPLKNRIPNYLSRPLQSEINSPHFLLAMSKATPGSMVNDVQVGHNSHSSAELAGRTETNFLDAKMAVGDMGATLPELHRCVPHQKVEILGTPHTCTPDELLF